jgi:hypothetical protein
LLKTTPQYDSPVEAQPDRDVNQAGGDQH